MARKRPFTQADIAREAVVSIATVDRVLNKRPGVNAQTAARVHEAIRRLQSPQNPSIPSSPAKSLHFDFILPAGPNTFLNMLHDATTTVGDRYEAKGVTIQCHRIEGFNASALADCIRSIATHSDGIAVMALENPLVREAVSAAVDDGTPVVTIVSNLASSRLVGYVGLNNRAAGRTAGYLMSRLLRKDTGKIALFEGSLDLSYRDHQEREMGFRDALREFAPGLEIVARCQTQDNFEEAYERAKTLMIDHPDTLGIYSMGGGSRGIARYLKEQDRGGDVVLVAHELTRHTREFLLDGTIDVILSQDPLKQAEMAIDLLWNYQTTGHAPSNVEHIPLAIYFRENLP